MVPLENLSLWLQQALQRHLPLLLLRVHQSRWWLAVLDQKRKAELDQRQRLRGQLRTLALQFAQSLWWWWCQKGMRTVLRQRLERKLLHRMRVKRTRQRG